jgi:hypothetical protein
MERRTFVGRLLLAVTGVVSAGGILGRWGRKPVRVEPRQDRGAITLTINPLAVRRTTKGPQLHG